MDIDNITSIKSLIINRKSLTHPFNLDFFMLLAEKSPKIFLEHKGYIFISESFALNWNISVSLTNKNLLLPL